MVYVDLDGVLLNFNKALAPAFGLVYPKNEILGWGWLKEKSGVTCAQFFEMVSNRCQDLYTAPMFPWTMELIQMLDTLYPEWLILSQGTLIPEHWATKVFWIKRKLGAVYTHKLLVTCAKKSLLAKKGDYLIDDNYAIIDAWTAAGGRYYRWLDYTEDRLQDARAQIDALSVELSAHVAGWGKS